MRRKHARILLLGIAPLAGWWHGTELHEDLNRQRATLEVEARVSLGSVFHVYFNNRWSEPRVQRIHETGWNVYRFEAPALLTSLRLDPSDAMGASIDIRRIELVGSESRVTLPLSVLESWPKIGIEAHADGNSIARLTTSQRGAYLLGTVDLAVARGGWIASSFRFNAATLTLALMIAAVAITAASLSKRQLAAGVALVLLLIAACLATYHVAPLAAVDTRLYYPVSETVGYAAYYAYSKTGEIRGLNLSIAAGIAVAMIGTGLLFRRRATPQCDTATVVSTRSFALLLLAIALFAVGTLPAGKSAYDAAMTVQHSDDYDSQNILFWNYAAASGYLPLADFWYPYSGMIDEAAAVYPYITFAWLDNIACFAVIGLSVFLLLRGSASAAIAIWAALFIAYAGGAFWPVGLWRYAQAASIALLGAAAVHYRRAWLAILFGLWTGYLVGEEVSQPIYAAPAIAVLFACSITGSVARRRESLRLILIAGASCAFYTALLLLRYWLSGQIAGWWEFLLDLPNSVAYTAWPLRLTDLLDGLETIQQIYFMSTVALLAAGAAQVVWSRFRSVAYAVPLALGIVSWMQLQKEFLRPGISSQVLFLPLLGLAVLMLQILQRNGHLFRAGIVAAYGGSVLLTLFFLRDLEKLSYLRTSVDIVSDVVADAMYTAGVGDWDRARERYFSPASLRYNGVSGDTFRQQLQAALHGDNDRSVFMLGDRPDLYILLNAPAPYYVTLYNQSPVGAQGKTLAWLKQTKPEWVLWDPANMVFDNVPNTVRVPLLFPYIVANYVPEGVVGQFHILHRRAPGQQPDVSYWLANLGSSVDLGYIPSFSEAPARAVAGGEEIARYMIIRSAAPSTGRVRTVNVLVENQPIAIRFAEREGVFEYPVNLERLPWSGLGGGLPPLAQNQEPGLEIRAKMLRFSQVPLY